MTEPKRAEPNEHAERLRTSATAIFWVMGAHDAADLAPELLAAAAEIERLAARVRELEASRLLISMDDVAEAAESGPIDRIALERPWLPIADAPRDGTRLELWYGDAARYGAFHEFSGKWMTDANGFYQKGPTHWRREPAGPESKPDQETKGER